MAGLGYTEGGVLAREYGGWRVICWAVILALPVSVPVTAVAAVTEPTGHVTARRRGRAGLRQHRSRCAWASSPGTRAWPRGGVARVGRLQLAQPALTLCWSALLLGEQVSLADRGWPRRP